MENCLKTQLKAIVANDELDFLGYIRIPLEEYSSIAFFQIGNNSADKYRILGNGVFCNNDGSTIYGKEIVPTFNFYIKDTLDGDILFISNKYNITNIYSNTGGVFSSTSEIDLSYCNSLTSINIRSAHSIIKLNEVSSYTKNLSTIDVVYANQVEGDIETIVENILKLGRNSGSLTIYGYSTKIRLNGIKFFTSYNDRTLGAIIAFGNNSATVTWKENTIATYDGSSWTYNN